MYPTITRDDEAMIRQYNAYHPDATKKVYYHIQVDGAWDNDLHITDDEAREVCRALVEQGASSVMALRALKPNVSSFSKGCEYIYPSTFAHHPQIWVLPPKDTK